MRRRYQCDELWYRIAHLAGDIAGDVYQLYRLRASLCGKPVFRHADIHFKRRHPRRSKDEKAKPSPVAAIIILLTPGMMPGAGDASLKAAQHYFASHSAAMAAPA